LFIININPKKKTKTKRFVVFLYVATNVNLGFVLKKGV
jgi:hypothetical protein